MLARVMPVRLVIVDDHQVLRDGMRLRLEHEKDFTVVGEAGSAEEAYDCIGRVNPDVVIMDLKLPGDNGIVATRRLREAWPQVRVIVLTGEAVESTAQEALLAGAKAFLAKGESSGDLIRAVRAVMAGKHYLSPDAATVVTQALAAGAAARGPDLSEQELAVLKGLAEGLAYKEIAAQLNVSVKSVETYRARLVKKTGSATRADLVRYAIRTGLVAP